MKNLLYRFWLSITATNAVSLSMILFSTKSMLKESLMNFQIQEGQINNNTQLTQVGKLRKENTIRIAIVDNKAYWVHNNIFYETEVVDGEIDKDAARPIDAHKLSKSKINMLLEILDSINN